MEGGKKGGEEGDGGHMELTSVAVTRATALPPDPDLLRKANSEAEVEGGEEQVREEDDPSRPPPGPRSCPAYTPRHDDSPSRR